MCTSLSDRERNTTLEICEQLIEAHSEKKIAACVCGPLKSLIGFKGVFGGLAENSAGGLSPSVMFQQNFPNEYLAKISDQGRIRPQTLQFWAKERKALALNFTESDEVLLSQRVTSNANRYGFDNMLCHGQVDPSGSHISYITLTKIEGTVSKKHEAIVSIIMPHLHNAFQQVARDEPSKVLGRSQLDLSWAGDQPCMSLNLSSRQRQVLYLIGLGKTNWEISRILCTSVDNIKYHIKRLNEIFSTNNRTAAVSAAIRRGAMPEDWPAAEGRPEDLGSGLVSKA